MKLVSCAIFYEFRYYFSPYFWLRMIQTVKFRVEISPLTWYESQYSPIISYPLTTMLATAYVTTLWVLLCALIARISLWLGRSHLRWRRRILFLYDNSHLLVLLSIGTLPAGLLFGGLVAWLVI
jgi:hypothetical protein